MDDHKRRPNRPKSPEMTSDAPSAMRLLALNAYYYLSWPLRRSWNWFESVRGGSPVMLLFYHRVADEHPNPWTISNQEFERQVSWLRKHFDLVSLSEGQRRLREGNHRPAISVTFDDGYSDNCQRALPFLIKQEIPFTYFVSSHYVESGEPFPHDVAAGKSLRPNTPDEIRALAEAGVEIGGHTRTHADLGQIRNPKRLYDEVIGGAEALAEMARTNIRYFAFPYGQYRNLSHAACDMLREHNFAGVCSAYGGYNFPGDDPFHLQRLHGDPCMMRIKNWTTVDPRKRRVPRVSFQASRPNDKQLHAFEATV
ncbi:MAG: polysaccharide deacetylase family protein [Planctomycetales bacterium]|nr:polysaccharide deacetylase family protein [Planctomycetales bacterium]